MLGRSQAIKSHDKLTYQSILALASTFVDSCQPIFSFPNDTPKFGCVPFNGRIKSDSGHCKTLFGPFLPWLRVETGVVLLAIRMARRSDKDQWWALSTAREGRLKIDMNIARIMDRRYFHREHGDCAV